MRNNNKIILDLCGGTGAWSNPYKENGYDVRLITLPDYDVRTYNPPDNVYGILAAPPCTMFSFARTVAKKPRNLNEGMEIVQACINIIHSCQYKIQKDQQQKPPLTFWSMENPNGMLQWFIGKPYYVFQPYEFGHVYSKKTHLWGYFNKPIKPLLYNPVSKGNTVSDLMWKDSKRRKEIKSITPSGFAKAFYEANK